MQTRIKKFILLYSIITILLASFAYSTKIFGFEELRFDGALTINSTSLSIRTSDTVRMVVDSSGLVGIGNLIPNNTLDVSGNANVSGIFYSGSINVTNNVEANAFIGDGSSLTGLTTGHPWNSSGTNLYLNDSTAKVGIGTTGPGEDLEIKSTTPELRFNDSDNSNYFDIGMSGTYFKIYSNDTSASGITVDLSGNVGIGNMIPNASLDVSGNIYLSATNPMINMSGPTIRKSGNDIVISD